MLYNWAMNTRNFIKRKSFNESDSGKIFFFSLIFSLVISLLFSLVATQIASTLAKAQVGIEYQQAYEIQFNNILHNTWFNLIYAIVSFGGLLLLWFGYNKLENMEIKATNINFNLKWHNYLIAVVVGLVMLFGVQYFIGCVDDLLVMIGYPVNNTSAFVLNNFGTFAIAVISSALFPAIVEEIIFRGVVLGGLRSRFKDWQAILLSALMFALMHLSIQQFVYQFMLGAVMAWIAIKSRSIVASMVVHFTNNFTVLLFAYLETTAGVSLALPNKWWFYLIMVALLAITVLVLWIINKFYFSKQEDKQEENLEVEEKRTQKPVSVILSIAFAVGVIIINTISLMLGGG